MAKGVDEQGSPIEPMTVFKRTDKQIYCTISIRGPEGVHLGARWYYGDKLISDYVIDFGKRQHGFWRLETKAGQAFPTGDYRVEIYLIKEAAKVAYFKIEE